MAQDHYKEDVQLLKRIGCTAYRFSVDWAKVMTGEDEFNQDAIDFYKDFCDELNDNGIKPVVTLYHYTEPIWFAEKGGFEKSENKQYFVAFCKKVMRELNTKVHLYFTFNSPIGGVALNSYQQGQRPPFKQKWKTTFDVIANIRDAHVAVYKAKEEVEKDLKCKLSVGILKNVHQLDPARVWHPVDQLVCSIGNKVQDDPFYQFFTTGEINMEFPFGLKGLAPYIPKLKDTYHPFKHINKDAPKSLDFIGLNYYGHRFMKGTQIAFNEREERCGTPGNYHPTYTIYAEGLYRALKTLDEKLVKPLEKNIKRHIPIYVTENGIGTDDDVQRNKFMGRYLYALSKAIQDGIDIRGYFCWSLMDNYEWGQYNKHYGLFKVNRETQERIFKPGSIYYSNVMLAYKNARTKIQWKKNYPQEIVKDTVNDVTVTIKEIEEPVSI
jgi:beta-glucosidase